MRHLVRVLGCVVCRREAATRSPSLCAGMDVIAQAQSGTGKTATFSIAILQQIDMALKECQALILAPTRELAQQIQKVVIALGDYMNAQCHACIGGTNVREDIRKLEKGVHTVVGTPGRVFDMISRKALRKCPSFDSLFGRHGAPLWEAGPVLPRKGGTRLSSSNVVLVASVPLRHSCVGESVPRGSVLHSVQRMRTSGRKAVIGRIVDRHEG